MSDTHATRGRRVLAFLLGLLLAFSIIPAEALAFVRDEVVVLGEEEGVGEVVVDGGVDLLEQEEDPDQKKLSADSVSGEFVYTAQSNELKKPGFEQKIADVNDSEGTLPDDITEITSDATEDPRWQDSADYDIGDHVPYRLDAQLPDDVDAYKGYHLTFTDRMEDGLTFDRDSVKVMVGEGQGAHEVTSYTLTPDEDGHGFKLTVRWGEQGDKAKDTLTTAELNGKHVYVYFTATLNEGARVGDEGNVNGAKLAFSNDANSDAEDEDHEDERDWDYVIAFTYKMEVNKKWANAYGEEVDPAKVEFRLEKVLADNSRAEVAIDEDSCETAENEAGEQVITSFAFRGLDDGDYVLTETAPEGFQGAGEVRFTVTAGHVTEWDKTSAARDAEGNILEASFPEGEGRDDGLELSGEAGSGDVTIATETDADGQYLAAEVTNLEIGSLRVTKTVAGVDGQEDKEFEVYVLNDNDEYLYLDGDGKVAYDESPHANLVSNANPLLLEGIPTGGYRVTEQAPGDIASGGVTYRFIGVSGETSASDDEGLVLRGQTTTVALTNTYTIPEKGALLIHKRVAGGRDFIEQMDKLVRFTVTDADGNVVASRLLGDFDEKIALPDGDSGIRVWTITGLDVGDYTVTESRDDADSDNPSGIDYEAYGLETGSSANVTVTAEQVTEIRPSNVYNEAAGWTKLRAKKEVDGSAQKDPDEAFTFDVALVEKALDYPDAEVKPEDVLPVDPTITAKAGETGETPNIYYSQTGSYYYSITERVPADPTPGMTYGAAHYARVVVHDDCTTSVAYGDDLDDLKAMTQQQVREAAGQAASATVTNRYELGNLEVKKELLGAPADAADQDFDVVVTSNESGKFVAADGTLSDEEQVLSVSKNTPLEINDIPVGTYTVTELESNRGIDLHTFVEGESTTKGTAVVPLNGTAKVVLTNAYKKNTISAQFKVRNVVKVIKGSKYTGTENFKFVLRAVTKGAPMPAQTTATAKAGGTASFGKITFDTEGEYLYSITEAKGTTSGMTYDTKPHYALVTVEEGEDSLVAEVTYGSTKDTADEDESLTITNTYGQTADLSVKKVVSSSRAADKAKSYKFKVTLYKDKDHKSVKKLTGTYGNLKFKNGVAKFTLKAGQTKTAKGLPVGTYYTAEETDSGGLVKSLSVKQTATGSVVTCTNTYRPTTPHRTTPGHTTRRTIKSATVSNIPDKVYSGKAIRPKPTIKLGKTKLTKNVDYTLEYYNNINVGTGVIVITGIGNYEDAKVCTFNIRKAPNALSVKAKKKSVKLSAVKKKAQVVAPLKVTGANGAVAYRKVANGSAPQLKVNKKTGKVTVKKGTKKGTYVIKIKVTASGNANHLSASKVVKVKVAVSGNAASKVIKSKIV